MADTALAFVFDSVEAAEAAVKRLGSSNAVVKSFTLDADVARYGIPSVHPGGQCVLLLSIDPHDEAYVSELMRGIGQLVPIPAPDSDLLSLEIEAIRTQNLWRSITEQNVAMSVAAALTLHAAYTNARAIVSRKDYDDALNMAASALSRVVPVYTTGPVTQKTVEVKVDLLTHRFAGRASQLRARDGDEVVQPLFVKRGDLQHGLSIIERAGRLFSFALLPPHVEAKASAPAALQERARKPDESS